MSQELIESRWGETKEALLEGLNGTKRNSMSVILENTRKYLKENAKVNAGLQKELDGLRSANIPKDVVFDQGAEVLGL